MPAVGRAILIMNRSSRKSYDSLRCISPDHGINRAANSLQNRSVLLPQAGAERQRSDFSGKMKKHGSGGRRWFLRSPHVRR